MRDFNRNFRLMGGSLVTGPDGKITLRMGSEESFAVSSVTLEPSDVSPVDPIIYNQKWLHPGNALFRNVIMPFVTRRGIRNYEKKRKEWMKSFHEGRRTAWSESNRK